MPEKAPVIRYRKLKSALPLASVLTVTRSAQGSLVLEIRDIVQNCSWYVAFGAAPANFMLESPAEPPATLTAIWPRFPEGETLENKSSANVPGTPAVLGGGVGVGLGVGAGLGLGAGF